MPVPTRQYAPRTRSGARALAAAVIGGIALTAAVAVACSGQPSPSVGQRTAQALASPTGSASSGVPVRSGALPSGSAEAAIRPAKLRIDKLGLTARVDPVGIDAGTGDFAVPPSIDVIGWYRYGPGLDATAGSVVVAGHVDSADQGRGAFFRLRDLAPGDRVSVTGTDGVVRVFTVVAREIFAKTAVPFDRYFARDGAPRLTLITCGGPFDPKTRHYRDNVVVTAQPTGSG